jgi:hypothetical protein
MYRVFDHYYYVPCNLSRTDRKIERAPLTVYPFDISLVRSLLVVLVSLLSSLLSLSLSIALISYPLSSILHLPLLPILLHSLASLSPTSSPLVQSNSSPVTHLLFLFYHTLSPLRSFPRYFKVDLLSHLSALDRFSQRTSHPPSSAVCPISKIRCGTHALHKFYRDPDGPSIRRPA